MKVLFIKNQELLLNEHIERYSISILSSSTLKILNYDGTSKGEIFINCTLAVFDVQNLGKQHTQVNFEKRIDMINIYPKRSIVNMSWTKGRKRNSRL